MDFIKIKIIVAIIIFSSPLVAGANVIITEIMYDAEGSDTGKEWVEITNIGSSDVVILGGSGSTWRFNDGSSNRIISEPPDYGGRGSMTINAGQSIVISNNPETFYVSFPSGNFTVLRSAMSLKNTGANLSLINENEQILDSASYSSELGANGDGNSLQKNGNAWLSGTPNPGVYSLTTNSGEENSNNSTESESGGVYVPPVNFPIGKISTKILGEKTVLSGADSFFEVESYGVDGELLKNARYLWNFGDGSLKEGEKILHNYIYPGEYIIFLDVSSESFSTSNKAYIKVIPSSIFISEVNEKLIKIKNSSKEELNLSLWILSSGNNFFIIPKNTYIRSGGEISFSNKITNLSGDVNSTKILYPNGVTAYEFNNVVVGDKVAKTPKISPPPVAPVEKVKEKVIEEEARSDEENMALNVASVATEEVQIFGEKKEGVINKWLLILVAIIITSVFGVLFIKRETTVEGYTIIE